ncbi:MAG: PKD domain-containing protein [Candidatus Sungbacteria bacterium]|nr:PKD domain-containing protein [Candidatus Sungbacteria bacterium]
MQRVILILFLAFFPFAEISAASSIARFVFITESRLVQPGAISDEIKIQAQDAAGFEIKTEETIDLEFLSTSSSGEFLNSSGNPVSAVMAKNTANRTFYYRDSRAGIYNITVKATGRDSGKSWSASQPITISDSNDPSADSSGENPSPVMPLTSSVSGGEANFASDKKIQAYAGEDRTVVAGANMEFSGSAKGVNGEPLTNARFWWNFGNGETKEGKTINYSFLIPGRYTMGLHVSSGEYSASDYAAIEVIPNQFSVSRVLMGEAGFAVLKNEGSVAVDVGGWILEDAAGQSFIIPPRTVINSKSETAFANSITGILFKGPALLRMRYPNLSLAFSWEEKAKIEAGNELRAATDKTLALLPSPVISQKVENASGAGKNVKSEEFSARPPAPKNISETATVSKHTGFSPSIFLAAAVFLGLAAAAGFIFVRRRS